MKSLRIAVMVGSVRTGSINLRLAKALTILAPDTLNFEWIKIDDLPFYNADFESNRPDEVNRFSDAIKACEGVLAIAPEYNRSVPALLKNAIDWGSKPFGHNVWGDKPIAVSGASIGAIGTAVGQSHLRNIFSILGAHVMGGEAYINFKGDDFIDPEGAVREDATAGFLKDYIERFADFARKLSA